MDRICQRSQDYKGDETFLKVVQCIQPIFRLKDRDVPFQNRSPYWPCGHSKHHPSHLTPVSSTKRSTASSLKTDRNNGRLNALGRFATRKREARNRITKEMESQIRKQSPCVSVLQTSLASAFTTTARLGIQTLRYLELDGTLLRARR